MAGWNFSREDQQKARLKLLRMAERRAYKRKVSVSEALLSILENPSSEIVCELILMAYSKTADTCSHRPLEKPQQPND